MKLFTKQIVRGVAVLALGSSFLAGCGGGSTTLTAAEQAVQDDIIAAQTAAASVAVAQSVIAAAPAASLETTETADITNVSVPSTDNAEPAPV